MEYAKLARCICVPPRSKACGITLLTETTRLWQLSKHSQLQYGFPRQSKPAVCSKHRPRRSAPPERVPGELYPDQSAVQPGEPSVQRCSLELSFAAGADHTAAHRRAEPRGFLYVEQGSRCGHPCPA